MTEPPASPGTPATRAADALGLAYAVTRGGPYGSLAEAAAALGLDTGRLVKSMVVRVSEDRHVIVLVPGDRQIAWPPLRDLLGVGRLSLATAEEAYAVTGYRRGTITPLGSRHPVDVVADVRVVGTISLGSGEPGVALTLDAGDLVTALGAQVADVTRAG